MKITIIILIVVSTIVVLLMACSSSDSRFEQVEYFKADHDRVFCIYTELTDQDEILAWAEKNLMNTEGALTQAFFFNTKEGIPAISGRTSLQDMYEVMSDAQYTYVYNVNPAGKVSIQPF